ncbi:type IV pili methyl-accepting chemotaxis transducer N-terminal domain-containing protein [Curvibacter sp. CHRR-16]|uniref:type IV pili methyl-accepting chemotaxis transducer N-terminal domain-containing protein n=1 Tax=Curvibacter sp. CHRR-16 TaxID=2835872 RepID=UPI001BD9D500|nr:type IV pili methyl-accepting chemotaxis transducer N-terminal domain-containing protein [Curvibacter sp. CHRR-16]MBT0571125.1 type IV pili methyl-accepting chemotaxis transducer N-terminal domain-containing protein [Curvibacter sp. CHRR-16]
MTLLSSTSLSSKLIRIGVTLLLLALTSIGLTSWVTWQLEGGAAAVNEAGRMRMRSWRMASEMQAGLDQALRMQRIQEMDRTLQTLEQGDPARPLFVPWDESVRARFAAVQLLWQAQRPEWVGQMPVGQGQQQPVLESADALVAAIDGLVGAIEQHLAKLTAVLNLFQFIMMALAIFAAVVMLYTGYLYVINPLVQLQKGLGLVEKGDFRARIEVDSQDEFALVAQGFNGMAARLQDMVDGLEAQVLAKTQRIEAQRARIETLYGFSDFLAGVNSIEEMSQGFSQRLRQVMGADAVTVRWSDEANQRFVMLASDCFPQEMQDHEHSLLAGACACGTPDTRTRVIPIHSLDSAPQRACAKVGYETMVSVPVRLQQRLLGEVNLFFRQSMVLSSEETELLDALASHLASALEGLRASALEREAAVSEERALLARELHDSIAQSLAFLKIQVQLLRHATQQAPQPQVQSVIDELDAGLKESINDVRELLVHFRTRTNTDDIEAALQETLQKFRHQTNLAVELVVTGAGLPLPSDVQIQVLHVVQEALSNVRKHAQASAVTLRIEKGRSWTFSVQDNGTGYAPAQTISTQHVGQHIMHERAQSIGAHVQIYSTPGQGTCVQLQLPEHPVTSAAAALK